MMPLFLSCSMVGLRFRNRLRKFLIKAFRKTFVLEIILVGGGPFGNGGLDKVGDWIDDEVAVADWMADDVIAAGGVCSKISILSENNLNESEFRFGL